MNKSYSVHAELPTTTVWVEACVFYNMKQVNSPPIKCKLFGMTCIEGNVPTFEVMTTDGYVFSEVPPHLIYWKEPVEENNKFTLAQTVYNNCLSVDFSLTQFTELASRKALVYIKELDHYEPAKYWFSLDFYKNYNWYHCMMLENGQFAFIPSHKIVFNDRIDVEKHMFPKYEKLRVTFQV